MIAFYGMGLLGANFVRALRSRGEEVHVWNRTHAKAAALEEVGAKVFTDPAEAARGATRVHVVLSDDDAVDGLLERIAPGLTPGVVIVDHTTTSATGAVRRAAEWRERGFRYLHAPVFMGPGNALRGTGVMLASGDRATFDEVAPELAKMTGRLEFVGDDPGRAAGLKLIGNLVLQALTGGMADGFALAKALDIPAEDAAGLFSIFNPANTVPYRLERMLSRDFSNPSWALSMARKDARLMLEEAARGGERLPVIEALAGTMDEWIAKGHSEDDWTVFARDAMGPKPTP